MLHDKHYGCIEVAISFLEHPFSYIFTNPLRFKQLDRVVFLFFFFLIRYLRFFGRILRIISRIIVLYLAMFLRDIVHLNIRGPVSAGTRHGAPKNETTCADAPEKYELAPCAPQEVDDDHSAVAHPDAEATGAESPARLS